MELVDVRGAPLRERRASLPEGRVWLADRRVLTPLPDATRGLPPGARAWQTDDGLRVIAGLEPYLDGRYGALLHVSFSRRNRLPEWREVRLVKDAFFGPDISAMVVLPQQRDYTNVHPFCHHIWQMPEPWSS